MTTVNNLPPEATYPDPRNLGGAQKDARPDDKPDMPRPALARMECAWDLPDLLLGGTEAMHAAGNKVLVQEEKESDNEFRRRMKRTVLTNYYGDTIDRHSGLPFAQTLKFDPPLPEALSYLETNADGCGRSITVLARELMREGMHRGMVHLLVDIPPNSGTDLAATLSRRPRMLPIVARDLLDVAEEPTQEGEDHVTYARIRQCRDTRVGRFGWGDVEQIMEIATTAAAAGETRVYEKGPDGEWLAPTITPYTRASIPLFTFYAKQVGDYEALPAYQYLAELNLVHFQSDADQRHGLSYGRRSTLVKTGWPDNVNPAEAAAKGQRIERDTTLGFGRQIIHKNDAARAYFLETGGAGLAAGVADLDGLERRMERFGAAQVSRDSGITATSRKLDDKRDTCNLEAWCTRMEGVLLPALRACAELRGVTLPANQQVRIDRSFADEEPPKADLPILLDMAKNKLLTVATLLAEVKARGQLVTVQDPTEEAQKLADETSASVEAEMQARAAQMLAARGPQAGDPSADPIVDPNAPAAPGGGA